MFSCYSPHILGILNALGAAQEREITTFDGIPYEGSIVNMGVKNADYCPLPVKTLKILEGRTPCGCPPS